MCGKGFRSGWGMEKPRPSKNAKQLAREKYFLHLKMLAGLLGQLHTTRYGNRAASMNGTRGSHLACTSTCVCNTVWRQCARSGGPIGHDTKSRVECVPGREEETLSVMPLFCSCGRVVHALQLNSVEDWQKWRKSGTRPVNLKFLRRAPFYQNGAKSGFEMCFGPSTLGAGDKTCLHTPKAVTYHEQ